MNIRVQIKFVDDTEARRLTGGGCLHHVRPSNPTAIDIDAICDISS